MTVVSDRVAWTFNKSTATQAVALDTCKAFDRVWYTGLLHKLKPQGISDHLFGLILPFLGNRRPRVVLDGSLYKNTQLILEFVKGPFLV